nr:hypothetical protein B23L21.190 [imported] - Neurospora crassa [Neurospora crassa]
MPFACDDRSISTDMLLFSTNRPVTPSPRLPFPVLLLPLLRLALPPVSALASTPSSFLVVLLASLPTSTSRPSRAPLPPALKRTHSQIFRLLTDLSAVEPRRGRHGGSEETRYFLRCRLRGKDQENLPKHTRPPRIYGKHFNDFS